MAEGQSTDDLGCGCRSSFAPPTEPRCDIAGHAFTMLPRVCNGVVILVCQRRRPRPPGGAQSELDGPNGSVGFRGLPPLCLSFRRVRPAHTQVVVRCGRRDAPRTTPCPCQGYLRAHPSGTLKSMLLAAPKLCHHSPRAPAARVCRPRVMNPKIEPGDNQRLKPSSRGR
jgi:hypothetical protein